MVGYSNKNTENFLESAFNQQKKICRLKFNTGEVSTNWSWNNWAQYKKTHWAMADGVISSKFSIVHSSRNSKIGLGCEPTEMYAINAKFFTKPTAWPSGVSAGHIIPQWVLCNWRGRASLPSLPMGEFRRRKWDKVDANVSLLRTCDTPARLWWAFFWSPQFPVAKEYLSPSVITFGLRASSMLKSCKNNDTKVPEIVAMNKVHWPQKVSYSVSSFFKLMLLSEFAKFYIKKSLTWLTIPTGMR